MPLLDPRRLGALFERLLRPDRAVRNAREAASATTRHVTERQSLEREVDSINVDHSTS